MIHECDEMDVRGFASNERKKNTDLRQWLDLGPVSLVIKSSTLSWFGRTDCKDDGDGLMWCMIIETEGTTMWLKKSPLRFSDIFSQTVSNFFYLHAYYMSLSTLDCRCLFSYLQLWQSYAILSVTTQRAFQLMTDILSIWCELGGRA